MHTFFFILEEELMILTGIKFSFKLAFVKQINLINQSKYKLYFLFDVNNEFRLRKKKGRNSLMLRFYCNYKLAVFGDHFCRFWVKIIHCTCLCTIGFQLIKFFSTNLRKNLNIFFNWILRQSNN